MNAVVHINPRMDAAIEDARLHFNPYSDVRTHALATDPRLLWIEYRVTVLNADGTETRGAWIRDVALYLIEACAIHIGRVSNFRVETRVPQ